MDMFQLHKPLLLVMELSLVSHPAASSLAEDQPQAPRITSTLGTLSEFKVLPFVLFESLLITFRNICFLY